MKMRDLRDCQSFFRAARVAVITHAPAAPLQGRRAHRDLEISLDDYDDFLPPASNVNAELLEPVPPP